MEFELECKREYYEELFINLGKEIFDESKEEFNQILKEIPLLILILLFPFVFFDSKLFFIFYVIKAIFIIIYTISKVVKYFRTKRSFKTFSWNYSEEYYKELLSYKSVKLKILGSYCLELNIDNEITIYDMKDISVYRIEDEFIYFIFNKNGNLIIPKKIIKSNNFSDLKLFCSNAIIKSE